METLKKCTKCKILKSISEFSIDNSRYDNLKATCNKCCNINTKNWYANNVEKARKIANDSYKKRKESISERRKQLRALNPEKHKESVKNTKLKNSVHYQNLNKLASWRRAGMKNMTIEKYEKMFELQKECCAICNIHQSKLKKKLFVDHDHTTGKVRGLLCPQCNSVLGYVNDSIEVLVKMIGYLKAHRS